MAKKTEWLSIPHLKRMDILRDYTSEQIVEDYAYEGSSDDFLHYLARERLLYDPANLTSRDTTGEAPNKEVVLGSWRDLDRTEALLELIDNSIDAWFRRRNKHPNYCTKNLEIRVEIDEDNGVLIFRDNAGGVSQGNINNLVVPGFSETDPLSPTIGSYKTGGKKAIFRLASAAGIWTRYWNPAQTTDQTLTIHLDEVWINDPKAYEFPFYKAKNADVIDVGTTEYRLQLRNEPEDAPWYKQPDIRARISKQIQNTYTLLLTKHPNISIFFNDKEKALLPNEHLYDFTGLQDGKKVDLRPQRVVFKTALKYQHQSHDVEIEVVLGCRLTTGSNEEKRTRSGIDLYGNDRLFVPYDHTTFSDFFPKGAARLLVRGYVNILGPNVFVPWDTHKRHLNTDRDVMEKIKNAPAVVQLFKNWREAYDALSRGKRGANDVTVTKLADHPYKFILPTKRAIDLPKDHDSKVDLAADPGGEALKFKPKVPIPTKPKSRSLALNIRLSTFEGKQLAEHFEIDVDSDTLRKDLEDAAKTLLLGLVINNEAPPRVRRSKKPKKKAKRSAKNKK